MSGSAGASFLLAVSILGLGLGLGPYCTGKIATLTGSLRTGMLSMIVVMPLALLLLWLASRRIGAADDTRVARARAAGEAACGPPPRPTQIAPCGSEGRYGWPADPQDIIPLQAVMLRGYSVGATNYSLSKRIKRECTPLR